MAKRINDYTERSGRMIKEDGSIVNIADKLDMEHYGATLAERPAANTVPIGAIYMAVDTQEAWQSNGASWVVII